MSNDHPQSICILRLSALGDITHMLPVVRTLQKYRPQSKITWIIGKTEFSLVDGMPNIEFIIFDKSKGKAAMQLLKQTLKGRRFDILLHMQAALRASRISRYVSAEQKIGFDRSRAADFQWLFSTRKITTPPRTHVLDGFFGFLEAIGIEERDMVWQPPIPESALAVAREWVDPTQSTLVINPSSSQRKNNFRNWDAKHYAALANFATEEAGLQVILTGGPATLELELADTIAAMCTEPPTNLVGKTSIKEMLAILSLADVIVAPDTGPLHMGTAVGTPVIGLYASSNPARTGPYNDLKHVINAYPEAVKNEFSRSVDDIPWGKRVRNPNAMALIQVDAVIEALQDLLQAR